MGRGGSTDMSQPSHPPASLPGNQMEEIILWEVSAETIRACELAAVEALRELGLKGRVSVNSEPPLISRNELWERLPVLEIRGQYWSLTPGRPFSKEQLVRLFRRLFCSEENTHPERK